MQKSSGLENPKSLGAGPKHGKLTGAALAFAGLLFGGVGDSSVWGALTGAAIGLLIAGWRAAAHRARELNEAFSGVESRLVWLEQLAVQAVGAPDPGVNDEVAARSRVETDASPGLAAALAGIDTAAPAEGRPATGTPTPALSSQSLSSPSAGVPPSGNGDSQPTPKAVPDIFDRGFAFIKGFFLGGNTVVRVGVLVFLVGVMLLAKYAADHSMFPVELRLAFAAALGLGLAVFGYTQRLARPGFSMSLQGGGVAALYLVVFFAYRSYSLVPAALAFPLFVAIAGACALLAVLQRAQPLLIIGSLGGFLAPIAASTGSGNHVALFAYYLILNAGVAAAAWRCSWRAPALVGFFCTYAVATSWGVLEYQAENFASTEPFVLAFMALFTSIGVSHAWRAGPQLRGIVDGTLIFGTPLLSLIFQARLVEGMEFGLAFSAAGFGLFYAVLATWLWRAKPQLMRPLSEAFIALAVGFATMAIPFALEEALTTSIAWALEGAGLYWVGSRQSRRLARFSGVLLQGLAAIAFLVGAIDGGLYDADRLLIANGRLLSCLALALGGFVIARQADVKRSALANAEWAFAQALGVWGLVWWSLGSLTEIDQFVAPDWKLTATVAWIALSALSLERVAERLQWRCGRILALTALPAGYLALLQTMEQHGELLGHAGFAVWPLLLAVIFYLLRRVEDELPQPLPRAIAPALWLAALVAACSLAGLAAETFELVGDWQGAAFGLGLAASLLGCVYAFEHRVIPLDRQRDLLLPIGVAPIAGFATLFVLGFSLTARGDASPLGHLPLLNPADLSMGLVAIGVLASWTCLLREHSEIASAPWRRNVAPVLGGVAFVWLNGVLVRAVHQWGDVAWHGSALWNSTALQVSFSIVWALIALAGMLASSRQHWRTPWMGFASLLGVVVVKLFLVDLSQLSTVAKIVTFLVVGALLLVVGYLSPVPPSRDDVDPSEREPRLDEGGIGGSLAGGLGALDNGPAPALTAKAES